VRRCILVVPALRKKRWENFEFPASLSYTARPCPKKTKKGWRVLGA
jgi:hypothetical protein